MSEKVFDAEETREEQAQRLCSKRVNRLVSENFAARKQFRIYASRLTETQRRSLIAYLRREFEQTLQVIEDVERDAPEFSFVPDHVENGEW